MLEMGMNMRRLSRLACAALATAGIAACGSSASSSSASKSPSGSSTSATTSASTSSPAAAQPQGAAFVVGGMCSCSGAQASVFGSSDKVLQTWASAVNASGGINGHPVKMITMDDGGNPATGLQDVKTLIGSDHVQAIADMSLADAAWGGYASSQGVPVLGGVSQEPTFLTNPDFFPGGTQLLVSFIAMAQDVKAAGKKHYGLLYCAESPICAQLAPIGKTSATLAGMTYVSGKISSVSPSYAAPCLQLKGAGVDAVDVSENGPVVIRFIDACAQQGYKPLGVYPGSELTSAALTDPNMAGSIGVSGGGNPYDSASPGVAAFRAALNRYLPGYAGSAQFGFSSILAWNAGELFAAAAKAGKLTPSATAAQVKAGLYKLHNETLGGTAPPLNFTPGKPAFIPCWFSTSITSGKFASLNGGKPTCLSAVQAKALTAGLKH